MSETKLETITTDTVATIGGAVAVGVIQSGTAAIVAAESVATIGGTATGVFAVFANPVSIPAWAAIVVSPVGGLVLGAGLIVGGAYLGKKIGKWLIS